MTKEKLYNAEVKERYLATFTNERTKETNQYALQKAMQTELQMKKDLYEMSLEELEEIMKEVSASTINSAYNYVFRFNQYIDWAIEEGYRIANINPFLSVEDKRDWSKKFVSNRKHHAFTRTEILDMCDDLVNYQDKAVLLSLFEGITGKGFSELLNLRTEDIKEIDSRHFATLYEKNGDKRTIEISDQLATYLYKADKESDYLNKNGLSDSVRSSRSVLVESPHIFKKSARGRMEGKLDGFYVNRKFIIFKEVFEVSTLTAKQITDSGIMHMVNEIHEQQGFISEKDWITVAEHYGASFVKYNDSVRRNITALKQVIFEKSFSEKYGYTPIEK